MVFHVEVWHVLDMEVGVDLGLGRGCGNNVIFQSGGKGAF